MKCPVCAEINGAQANFCAQCGSPLGRLQLGGERRRISVMFADIAGSTALIAGRDPEEARALLDRTIDVMTHAVHRYGGCVIRIAGDGIVALFGAPVAHEDHAVLACLAALRIQADLAAAAVATSVSPVLVRIGINAGEVLLRVLMSDLRSEYAAEGSTTHLAAKIEQAAQPGSVLLSGEVMRLVQGYMEARPAAPLVVPGLAAPVEVHELIGSTGANTRFEIAARRGLARFVGRERELLQLERAAGRSEAGQLQAVGVVGEAGIGKTRLIWEFRQRLQALRWDVFEARSTAHGVRSAYFPIIRLLHTILGVGPEDGQDDVARKLASADPGGAIDLAPLLALLDRPVDEARWAASDPKERSLRTFDALSRLLAARARARPTAIVIEDLHWADGETLSFVRHLVRQPARERLLLVLEYRPDLAPELSPSIAFEAMHLQPLPDVAAQALFEELAGCDASLARLAGRLLPRVAGNPFFLEESIRMLSGSGVLAGEPGRHRLGRPNEPITIPDTVTEVLAARIAALKTSDRELVQLAAVVGRNIHLPTLRALADVDAGPLQAGLQRLVDAGLMQSAGNPPEHSFRHAFTHEVAYHSMLRQRRCQAHSQAADLLLSMEGDAPADRIELLAHHAVCAERWDDAIVYLRSSADRAFERSAAREAVRLLDEALLAVGRTSPVVNRALVEADLRLALRGPLVALGHVRRVGEELRRAQALTAADKDLRMRYRTLVYACGDHWFAGSHQAAIDAGRQALALADEVGDSPLHVPLRQYLGGALHALGDHAAAQEMLSANVREVPEDAPGHRFGMAGLPAVFCRATRCWSYEHQGRFAEAAADANDSLRIAYASGHGFSIQGACFAAGNLHLSRGEFDQARRLLEEALAISGAEHHTMWVSLLGPLLALATAAIGDPQAAVLVIDRTVPRPDDPLLTTFTRLAVAEAYASIGRLGPARQQAEATLLRARGRGERIWQAESLHLLGRIAQMPAELDVDAAAAAHEQALEGARVLHMRPLQGRCLLGLASANRRLGRTEEAMRALAEAQSLFDALELPYWQACARAQARNLG